MDIGIGFIKKSAAEFGLEITDNQKSQLEKYAEMLIEWNQKINLTAIVEPKEIGVKHFLDSMLIFKNSEIPYGAKIIDVGTGAGFPGVVMKIVRPDIELTLLDGLNKRLVFLSELCEELGIDAETVHSRAEEAGKSSKYREKYDIATARAVAKLNVLSEYCLPFVKTGGSFIALKGPAAEEEITESESAVKLLGGGKIKVFSENLADCGKRIICEIKKISQTPTAYPRISAKISKKPL